MDRLDRGHDADPRPGDAGQVGDLAADVHPHLEDGRLVLRAEAQERQRQADLVVLVALVAQRPEAAAEDGSDGLLGRGLGDAPGHADDQRIEPAAPAGGDRPERGQRVGDADDRDVAERGRVGDRSRDDERGSSPGDRVGQVGVAIGPLAGECDEHLARRDQPGIDGGAADRVARTGRAAGHRSGGPGRRP